MPTVRVCEICGKSYRPIKGNQKYCPVCKSKKVGRKELRKIVCTICGDTFMSPLYNKKYCSKACRDLSKIDLSRMEKKVCGVCSKLFETTRKEKIYCSTTCAGIAKRAKDKLWREKNVGKC